MEVVGSGGQGEIGGGGGSGHVRVRVAGRLGGESGWLAQRTGARCSCLQFAAVGNQHSPAQRGLVEANVDKLVLHAVHGQMLPRAHQRLEPGLDQIGQTQREMRPRRQCSSGTVGRAQPVVVGVVMRLRSGGAAGRRVARAAPVPARR